jgi:RNA polymerase sigma-70 factor (ECF subfamily)
LGGWLTTVVARVCLDELRSRKARREESLDGLDPEPLVSRDDQANPEREALLADSVGLALLVVLEQLAPAERLAFVLHDMFAVPFEEIAPILDRSAVAVRQLASRARRRVQGAAVAPEADLARQRELVTAFIKAARDGDFDGLLAVLDPEVVVRADRAAVGIGGLPEVRGARDLAQRIMGRARNARLALVARAVGVVFVRGGRLGAVLRFTFADGKIAAIDVVADPKSLSQLNLTVLND